MTNCGRVCKVQPILSTTKKDPGARPGNKEIATEERANELLGEL